MRTSVREAWLGFTEGFEGGVASLYQDIRGLVTVAYGNLCDSAGQVATLAMVHPNGEPATVAEKVAAWERVKGDPHAAKMGWRYAAKLTDLRMTREGMADLAYRKLGTNETALRMRLPEFDDYPACAQMALFSLAWACGPAANFPKLFAACSARDWELAAVEIHMNERTPEGKLNAGLVPRNVANKVLMRNAAKVDAYKLDPETLDWINEIGVSALATIPDLSVHDEPTNPGATPSIYAGREEVTGSGGVIHQLRYDRGPGDPDDAA